jgi:hypothetical protein
MAPWYKRVVAKAYAGLACGWGHGQGLTYSWLGKSKPAG